MVQIDCIIRSRDSSLSLYPLCIVRWRGLHVNEKNITLILDAICFKKYGKLSSVGTKSATQVCTILMRFISLTQFYPQSLYFATLKYTIHLIYETRPATEIILSNIVLPLCSHPVPLYRNNDGFTKALRRLHEAVLPSHCPRETSCYLRTVRNVRWPR